MARETLPIIPALMLMKSTSSCRPVGNYSRLHLAPGVSTAK